MAALAWGGFSGHAVAQGPFGRRGPGEGPMQQVLQTLTPEERQEFVAAHRAAKDDPAVMAAREAMEAAQKEFKSVMEKAMLQQDPSLQAVFEKLEAPASVGATPSATPGQPGRQARPLKGHGWGAQLKDLTVEERQKMQAAHAAIRTQPEVQRVEATRAAADKEFHETVRAAMLKADPAVGPIVDKVEAAMKEMSRATMRRGLGSEPRPAPSATSSPVPPVP